SCSCAGSRSASCRSRTRSSCCRCSWFPTSPLEHFLASSSLTQQASQLSGSVEAAFEPDGPLACAHPGFAERIGQRRMAVAVAQAIEDGDALVAEAGTGTGKTYAYLVPALLCGGRVLIST